MKHSNFSSLLIFFFLIIWFGPSFCSGQAPKKILSKYTSKEIQKLKLLTAKRDKSLKKYLKKFNKSQEKLLRKMCKENSNVVDALSTNWDANNRQLINQLTHPNSKYTNGAYFYSPEQDTLLNSLNYFGRDSLSNPVNQYLYQLKRESLVEEYMQDQVQSLDHIRKIMPNYQKLCKPICKQSFYFKAQNDCFDNKLISFSNFEKRAFAILKGDKKFCNYLEKNSSLNNFNHIPESWGEKIEGLQTIGDISNLQNQYLNKLDSQMTLRLLDRIQASGKYISTLKNGSVKSKKDLGFRPNPLKTKSFLERLDFNLDFQFFNQANNFLPGGLFNGFSIKYRLLEHLDMGLGLKYPISFEFLKSHNRQDAFTKAYTFFVDYRVKRFLDASAIYESEIDSKAYSSAENQFGSIHAYKFSCGLTIILPCSNKVHYTISMLYSFIDHYGNGKANPISVKFGFQF